MKCIYCQSSDTKVIDKRDSEDLNTIRRRRECLKCEKRFTTYERVESSFTVIKKEGSRESFDRNKLKTGIQKACEKRKITDEDIENIVNEIEQELRNSESPEVESKNIGKLVMKKLKKLDKISYIRFASIYKDFEDLEDYQKELNRLAK